MCSTAEHDAFAIKTTINNNVSYLRSNRGMSLYSESISMIRVAVIVLIVSIAVIVVTSSSIDSSIYDSGSI